MLQIQQASDQSRARCRPATRRLKRLGGDTINRTSVDQRRQLNQRMTLIQLRHQWKAKQLARMRHISSGANSNSTVHQPSTVIECVYLFQAAPVRLGGTLHIRRVDLFGERVHGLPQIVSGVITVKRKDQEDMRVRAACRLRAVAAERVQNPPQLKHHPLPCRATYRFSPHKRSIDMGKRALNPDA